MPLEKQNIAIPFAKGVDTKTDPKQVMVGKLLKLENGYFKEPGSIAKRNGYTALSKNYIVPKDYRTAPDTSIPLETGVIAAGRALAATNGELVMSDNDHLYSWSPADNQWIRRGYFEGVTIGQTPIIRTFAQQTNPDSCHNAATGIQMFVWEQAIPAGFPGANLSLYDPATGNFVIRNVQVTRQAFGNERVSRPRCVSVGAKFLLFFWDDLLNQVFLNVIDPATGAITYKGAVATDADVGSINFDVAANNIPLACLAYNAAATGVKTKTFDATGALVGSNAIGSAVFTGDAAIGVFSDDQNRFWIIGSDGVATLWFTIQAAVLLTQVRAPEKIENVTFPDRVSRITGAATGAETASIFFNNVSPSGPRYNNVWRVNLVNDAFPNGFYFGYSAGNGRDLASKAFYSDGAFYVWTSTQSTLQSAYYLMKCTAVPRLDDFGGSIRSDTQSATIAKVLYGIGGGHPSRSSVIPGISLIGGVYSAPMLRKENLSVSGGNVFTQTGIVLTTVTLKAAPVTKVAANTLHLSGGILWMYDGKSVAEHGFFEYPEGLTSSQAAVGGFIGAGTYEYVVVFEWMDAFGQIHRSAPSPALSVTVAAGATNTVTITTPRCLLTNKIFEFGIGSGADVPLGKATISAAVYRTTNAGTLFFRVSPLTTIVDADLTNANASPTVSFIDTLADASITGNEQLYTTGGVVENISPSAVKYVGVYKTRLVAIPSEAPNSFAYSKEILPDTPADFSDLFVQNVNPEGGDGMAALQLDEKLVILKRHGAIAIVGDGPTPNGSNNDLTPGQLVVGVPGCLEGRSAVAMPDGIMYQSDRGIELLDRSLAPVYVGFDVEDYLAGALVTSAILLSKINQVRFTLSSGVCLVYDYLMKGENGIGQWSVFTNHAAVAAAFFSDAFAYVKSDGQVQTETAGLFTELGAFIQMTALTAWLSLAGIQGFQRAYKSMVLGQFKSAHHLSVKVAYDFDATLTQSEDIDATAAVTPYQWRVLLERQSCEALQFQIQDTNQAGTGESFSLSSLALEVGGKRGLNKPPQTRTYS